MSNYCIKMLLAADLSSMSLRGKWFDFNTPNDVVPKKCRVLYEPSLLINNPDLKKDAWEDLKEIKNNWVVRNENCSHINLTFLLTYYLCP